MKVKINITQNEMHALLTALRIQKQELTERMLFKVDDVEIPKPQLMMMFDQTDNIYQQVLTYVSESMKTELKQRDIDYLDELHDIRESIIRKG
jgi:Trp operon repressor